MKHFILITLVGSLIITSTSYCPLEPWIITIIASGAAGCGVGCITGIYYGCGNIPFPCNIKRNEQSSHNQTQRKHNNNMTNLKREDAALTAELAQLKAQYPATQSIFFELQLPRNSGNE